VSRGGVRRQGREERGGAGRGGVGQGERGGRENSQDKSNLRSILQTGAPSFGVKKSMEWLTCRSILSILKSATLIYKFHKFFGI
jgi:hypothetical protein